MKISKFFIKITILLISIQLFWFVFWTNDSYYYDKVKTDIQLDYNLWFNIKNNWNKLVFNWKKYSNQDQFTYYKLLVSDKDWDFFYNDWKTEYIWYSDDININSVNSENEFFQKSLLYKDWINYFKICVVKYLDEINTKQLCSKNIWIDISKLNIFIDQQETNQNWSIQSKKFNSQEIQTISKNNIEDKNQLAITSLDSINQEIQKNWNDLKNIQNLMQKLTYFKTSNKSILESNDSMNKKYEENINLLWWKLTSWISSKWTDYLSSSQIDEKNMKNIYDQLNTIKNDEIWQYLDKKWLNLEEFIKKISNKIIEIQNEKNKKKCVDWWNKRDEKELICIKSSESNSKQTKQDQEKSKIIEKIIWKFSDVEWLNKFFIDNNYFENAWLWVLQNISELESILNNYDTTILNNFNLKLNNIIELKKIMEYWWKYLQNDNIEKINDITQLENILDILWRVKNYSETDLLSNWKQIDSNLSKDTQIQITNITKKINDIKSQNSQQLIPENQDTQNNTDIQDNISENIKWDISIFEKNSIWIIQDILNWKISSLRIIVLIVSIIIFIISVVVIVEFLKFKFFKYSININKELNKIQKIYWKWNIKKNFLKINPFEIFLFMKKNSYICSPFFLINFLISLKTRWVVVLLWWNWVGKTSFVENLIKWIYNDKFSNFYKKIIVNEDLDDESKFLWMYDRLNNNYIDPYWLTKLITKAYFDRWNPYFVLLDEMNMSSIEKYFPTLIDSDAIQKEWVSNFIKIWEISDADSEELKIRKIKLIKEYNFLISQVDWINSFWIKIPNNLYLIWTINIDKITEPFSWKILDRVDIIKMNFMWNKSFEDETQQSKKLNLFFWKNKINTWKIKQIDIEILEEIKTIFNISKRTQDSIDEYLIETYNIWFLWISNVIYQKILPQIFWNEYKESLIKLKIYLKKYEQDKTINNLIQQIDQILNDDFINFWKTT